MLIETPRLFLREVQMEDEASLYRYCNPEPVRRYLMMDDLSPAQWHEYCVQMTQSGRDYALVLRETGEAIGKLHLQDDDLRFDVNSIGMAYEIGQPFMRRGLMTEAIRGFLPYLFQTLGYDCLTVRVLAPNVASRRLMEALGFTQEAYLRRAVHAFRTTGEIYDDVIFSLQREDWEAARGAGRL